MEKKPATAFGINDPEAMSVLECVSPKAKRSGFPVAIDGRFKYIKELGQGGSGRICLAYDNKLQRNVALKFLISSDPQKTQMLLQEARAQAQLKHENICQIHEVNESQNQIYLVMQYIQGEPLNRLSYQLNSEQKLLIVYKILSGLQQAHHQGIIHRDIKPSNILVEISEQGELKPYLIDFGIAHRDQEGEQLALNTGLGTPNYMAPEQNSLNANTVDRRADIYSVGATLYHLFTGQPLRFSTEKSPQFSNGSQSQHHLAHTVAANTLSSSNSINNSTEPLSDLAGSIPMDLQSLILKCLMIHPNERYSSAKALADDIDLYLKGEPVSVHSGLTYRAFKKVRKHRVLVGLASLFFITIIVSGSWFVYQKYQQKIREQMIQQFSAKVENMEARVRFSYMSPLHDVAPEIDSWKREIVELEQEIVELGALADGPGNYAIGRLYYSLQEYDEALNYLQLAWESGFQPARVAYVLALTHGALYQRKKETINNIPDKSAREEKLIALDKIHRQPAIQRLEVGLKASPHKSIAQAVLYYHQERFEQALAVLQQPNDYPVWFYQHKVLAGDIYQAMAEKATSDDKDEKIKRYNRQALENYQQALTIAPSDFQLQTKPITVSLTRLARIIFENPGDFRSQYQKAKNTIALAKQNHSQNYLAYVYHGKLLYYKSEFENQNTGNPLKALEQAIEQFNYANVLNNESPYIGLLLALMHTKQVILLQERGLNTVKAFENASAAFKQIKESDRGYVYYNTIGSMLNAQAVKLSNKAMQEDHANYNDYFLQASTAFNKATSLQPANPSALINSGSSYLAWAAPLPPQVAKDKLVTAINKFKQAKIIEPQNFVILYYLGVSYRRLSYVQDLLFEENSGAIDRCRYWLDSALALGKQHPFVLNEIAKLEFDRAVYKWQKGKKYQALIDQSIDRIDYSLKQNPGNHILLATRASFFFNANLIQYVLGKFSQKDIRQTYDALSQAEMHSSYNSVEKVVLRILENKEVSAAEVGSFEGSDDRYYLLKAVWYSRQGEFFLAEEAFEHIKKLPHSVVLLLRRRMLLFWMSHKESKKIVGQKLKILEGQLALAFPALFNLIITHRD